MQHCQTHGHYYEDDERCEYCPITQLHKPEPPREEIVRSSAVVATLGAALRDASAARAAAEKPWNGEAFNQAWSDERSLKRAIEIMRSRGATAAISDSPTGTSTEGAK